jgi:hypothetical protein
MRLRMDGAQAGSLEILVSRRKTADQDVCCD